MTNALTRTTITLPTNLLARVDEESLRQQDFAFIEFRDSPAGRQAYLKGTRLAIWRVAMIARHCADPVPQTAAHLQLPARQIVAALNYAAAYPEEIGACDRRQRGRGCRRAAGHPRCDRHHRRCVSYLTRTSRRRWRSSSGATASTP